MEQMRKRFAQDQALFPDHNVRKSVPTSAITISSTSSSPEVAPTKARSARPIVVSSDEEEDEPPARAQANQQQAKLQTLLKDRNVLPDAQPVKAPAKPIHIPSNRDVVQPTRSQGETFEFADDPRGMWEMRTTAADAENALRDLVAGSYTGEDEVAVEDDDAIVEGFRDGVELLPHQVIGRAWMRERESGKKCGGILADDMGLGKTIQTLTRIVEGKPTKADRKEGWAKGTLVVCPVALVGQWATEIAKMAVGLKVIEHHGASRTTDPLKLQTADVVVCSYPTVASEYNAYKPEAKDESKAKSKAKAKKSQSPVSSDDDDSDSSAEHFGRTLVGKAKTKPKAKPKAKHALFQVSWWRVVLDEAHNIKNRNTRAAMACCELEGKYRWCLTGTPMQNNVEELYSLFKFLRIRPLNDWAEFNESINKPVKAGKTVRAMKRLQVVLKSIMLRRQKDHQLNGKPILQLPDRIVEVVPCKFDASEQEFYKALEAKMSGALDKLMQSDQIKNSYTSVLVMLLRLRQACNHPALVSKDYRADTDALESKTTKDDDEGDELAAMFGALGVSGGRKCAVCQESITPENAAPNDSSHCIDCVDLAEKARRKSIVVGGSDLPPDSAKVRKILELLQEIEEREDSEEKTIIFSQFTTMLDLIQPFLRAEGIKYCRYDGSMSKDQREDSLTKIRNSSTTKVILISFKAGSTGLNLTACSNVILVDMWWNPALEDQAFDRAHRFGQKRDVHIYKLTIPLTVEERILGLQEQKRALAKAALSGDKIKNMKLGMEDLLALFRHGGGDDEEED
ncbi:hypothetical protein PLICRDRAFT_51622 [Plicaturopsis crispa FD-325 SS-3]|nr:hypothetical protein PLICRDRAFT_51622 [Plicaturopsis crispa FD-325 SS-3]